MSENSIKAKIAQLRALVLMPLPKNLRGAAEKN
jgi:hypothetical protein